MIIAISAPSIYGQKQQVESEREWKDLFDGKTTAGWRGFRKTEFPRSGWIVEEGSLKHVQGGGGGDIVTIGEYYDFELEWEWRISPGANSGVKYMIVEERGAPTGHEYQIWDDAHRPPDKHTTGSLYDLLAPDTPPRRATGEFNHSRIIVRGSHAEHWLNGKKIVEYELGSPELLAAVAKSKFSGVPGFGTKIRGHILLQDHGGEVWYRNIRLRELPAQ